MSGFAINAVRGGVAALTVTALCLGPTASAAVSKRADPAGDVQASSSATQAQRDTVDITQVTYEVRDERLVITTTFGGLSRTPGKQTVTTQVGTGGSVFNLTSTVGGSSVKVGSRSCAGTDAFTDFDRLRVLQYVPVSCLDADLVRLKSSSKLTSSGSLIARDGARRSGDVAL